MEYLESYKRDLWSFVEVEPNVVAWVHSRYAGSNTSGEAWLETIYSHY